MKLYHGTTYEACQDILKNGFSTKNKNWDVSLDEVYFWNETSERNADKCIQRAYSLATIAAACQNSQSDKVCIIAIDYDVPTHLDESCEEPSEERVAAYVGNVNEIIQKFPSSVSVIEFRYHPELRASYLYNEFSINTKRWKWLKPCIKDFDALMRDLQGLAIIHKHARFLPDSEKLRLENNRL